MPFRRDTSMTRNTNWSASWPTRMYVSRLLSAVLPILCSMRATLLANEKVFSRKTSSAKYVKIQERYFSKGDLGCEHSQHVGSAHVWCFLFVAPRGRRQWWVGAPSMHPPSTVVSSGFDRSIPVFDTRPRCFTNCHLYLFSLFPASPTTRLSEVPYVLVSLSPLYIVHHIERFFFGCVSLLFASNRGTITKRSLEATPRRSQRRSTRG